MDSFGSSNKFRSSESYILFYRRQNFSWDTPIVSPHGLTSTTLSHRTLDENVNTSTEQNSQPLSTPVSNHIRTSTTQSVYTQAQNTTIQSPFHQRVLPLSDQFHRIEETRPPGKKLSSSTDGFMTAVVRAAHSLIRT